jgi:hypothetical protein
MKMMTRKTIFFVPEGPMIRVGGGVIEISDLNPEVHLSWSLSRFEILKLAFGFMRAALRPSW